MKSVTYISTLLVALLAVVPLLAISEGFKPPVAPAFSRYQGILERMPFGAAPLVSAATALTPTDALTSAQELKEQQLLARQINMSCVNVTPAGKVAVGFTDMASKPPISYYLLVGADSNGWLVKSADYDGEWAELEKDGVTIFVKLGEGLMTEPPERKTVAADQKSARSVTAGTLTAGVPDNRGIAITAPPHRSNPIAERLAEMHNKGSDASNDAPKDNAAIKSYIERLRERKLQEKSGQESEKQASLAQLTEIARKVAKEELNKSKLELGDAAKDLQITPEEAAALEIQ